MLAIIRKFIAKRKQKQEEYRRMLKLYTELFGCGQSLWEKIKLLEERKIYVEEKYEGSHKVDGFEMTIRLKWRGFDFELSSITPRIFFSHCKVLEEVGKILAKKWGDKNIENNLWEPIWYKDGVRITGIEHVQGLTGAMLSDFNNLLPKTTEEDANKFAEKVIVAVANRH